MRGSNVSLITILPFPQQGYIRGLITVGLVNNSSSLKEQTYESLLSEMLPRSGFVQRKSSAVHGFCASAGAPC